VRAGRRECAKRGWGHFSYRASSSSTTRLSRQRMWRDKAGPTTRHDSLGQTRVPPWHPQSCQRIWHDKVVESRHLHWHDERGQIVQILFFGFNFRILFKKGLNFKKIPPTLPLIKKAQHRGSHGRASPFARLRSLASSLACASSRK
jgi:hypothetical protein